MKVGIQWQWSDFLKEDCTLFCSFLLDFPWQSHFMKCGHWNLHPEYVEALMFDRVPVAHELHLFEVERNRTVIVLQTHKILDSPSHSRSQTTHELFQLFCTFALQLVSSLRILGLEDTAYVMLCCFRPHLWCTTARYGCLSSLQKTHRWTLCSPFKISFATFGCTSTHLSQRTGHPTTWCRISSRYGHPENHTYSSWRSEEKWLQIEFPGVVFCQQDEVTKVPFFYLV